MCGDFGVAFILCVWGTRDRVAALSTTPEAEQPESIPIGEQLKNCIQKTDLCMLSFISVPG